MISSIFYLELLGKWSRILLSIRYDYSLYYIKLSDVMLCNDIKLSDVMLCNDIKLLDVMLLNEIKKKRNIKDNREDKWKNY